MKSLHSRIKIVPQVRRVLLTDPNPVAKSREYQARYQGYSDRDQQIAQRYRNDPDQFRYIYNGSLAHRRVSLAMDLLAQLLETGVCPLKALNELENLSWQEVYDRLGLEPEQPVNKFGKLPS